MRRAIGEAANAAGFCRENGDFKGDGFQRNRAAVSDLHFRKCKEMETPVSDEGRAAAGLKAPAFSETAQR